MESESNNGRPPEPPLKPPPPPLVIFIVVALVAYGGFQIVKTGVVDKYLIGALVILALAFAGYGGDRLLERVVERWK